MVEHIGTVLAWLGWVVGVVSGALQVHSWRRDRRLGPAREQLFEEALRDRKGAYSERQINELTSLVRRLERASRTEIPRQARRVFLQSQLEAINESVATGVQRHGQLRAELRRLDQETDSIPKPLVDIIDSSIRPPAERRRRQTRRLYLVASLVLASAVLPGPSDFIFGYIRDSSDGILDTKALIYGADNIVPYCLGLGIGLLATFSFPLDRVLGFARNYRSFTAAMVVALYLVWAGLLAYIGYRLHHPLPDYGYDYTVEASALSILLFCIATALLSLLRRKSPM